MEHLKYEQIIEAAVRRFSHFGTAKTTTNEIANDLRIAKGTLYYYFEDKKMLQVAAIKFLVEKLFTEIKDSIANLATSQMMETVLHKMAIFFKAHSRFLNWQPFLFEQEDHEIPMTLITWFNDHKKALFDQIIDLANQNREAALQRKNTANCLHAILVATLSRMTVTIDYTEPELIAINFQDQLHTQRALVKFILTATED